jgi:hypothetical protein
MLYAGTDVRARWIAATLDTALSELKASGRRAELSASVLALISEARRGASLLADTLSPAAPAVSSAPRQQMPHARNLPAGGNVLAFPGRDRADRMLA